MEFLFALYEQQYAGGPFAGKEVTPKEDGEVRALQLPTRSAYLCGAIF